MLTSVGVFLFTRTLIPESILTFFLLLALYSFLTGIEDRKPARFYLAYAALALALLAKGLIAPVFFVAAVVPYLIVTGEWRRWRQFHLFTGLLLFLAIGAPWHILAGLRNPDHGNPIGNVPTPGHVHGFFYFYFINEHFLRFLGLRYPHDYNRQPWYVFWLGQLIWLFPWSLYLPVVLRRAWRNRHLFYSDLRYDSTNTIQFLDSRLTAYESSALAARLRFRARTSLLLALYAGFILIFFAISTNQEYYTWPMYPALLMLIAGGLSVIEESQPEGRRAVIRMAHRRAGLLHGHRHRRRRPARLGTVGVAPSALHRRHRHAHGASRRGRLHPLHVAFLRPHRPILRRAAPARDPRRRRLLPRTHSPPGVCAVAATPLNPRSPSAFTTAVILIAAHIALVRFEPMLSSRAMAHTINRLTAAPANADAQLMLYGDQADGSSIIFYTHRPALLVHGATQYFSPDPETHGQIFGSSMIWGSDYPDAPHIFLSDADLLPPLGHRPAQIPLRPRRFSRSRPGAAGARLYPSPGTLRQNPLHRSPPLKRSDPGLFSNCLSTTPYSLSPCFRAASAPASLAESSAGTDRRAAAGSPPASET